MSGAVSTEQIRTGSTAADSLIMSASRRQCWPSAFGSIGLKDALKVSAFDLDNP